MVSEPHIDGEPHYGFCNLCEPPRRIELEVLFEHFRIVHDFVPEIEEWPDGEPVIVDTTLEADDFLEGES